ncbi:DUF4275 family protein [Paenibacillus favisporus]|uniref:DUF4275 family protein n=1 Tax=Paenibacillus favisporus TaxID=221028 RepID=UPI002DBF8E30|nr:DUF4275 family protein [Paenibacillus favisporus]MEC0178436.1 DUF4275 family protein [Paenibacillus favisporus]
MQEIFWTVEAVRKNYLFKKNLQDKGVVVSEIYEGFVQIVAAWDCAFAHNISEETKKVIHYDQFKWHIFSYEKKRCLKEEAARHAFDELKKDEIYIMYQSRPYIYLYENAQDVRASDFDSEQDIYIFDKKFTWTYIHTHESSCGPYLYKTTQFECDFKGDGNIL